MEIRKLNKFSKEELLSIMTGFVSEEAYIAEKTETDEVTNLALRLTMLSKPNVKICFEFD